MKIEETDFFFPSAYPNESFTGNVAADEENEEEENVMEPVAGRLEIRVVDKGEGSAVVETLNNNLSVTGSKSHMQKSNFLFSFLNFLEEIFSNV